MLNPNPNRPTKKCIKSVVKLKVKCNKKRNVCNEFESQMEQENKMIHAGREPATFWRKPAQQPHQP